MQRSSLATRRFYAAFYRWNTLTNNLPPCHHVNRLRQLRRRDRSAAFSSRTYLRDSANEQIASQHRPGWQSALAKPPVQSFDGRPFDTIERKQYVVRERSEDTLTIEIAVPLGSYTGPSGHTVDYALDPVEIESRYGGHVEVRTTVTRHDAETGDTCCSVLLSGTFDQTARALNYIRSVTGDRDALRALGPDARFGKDLMHGLVVPASLRPFSSLRCGGYVLRDRADGKVTAETAMPCRSTSNDNVFKDKSGEEFQIDYASIASDAGAQFEVRADINRYDPEVAEELCSVFFSGTPQHVHEALTSVAALVERLPRHQCGGNEHGPPHANVNSSPRSAKLPFSQRPVQTPAEKPFDTLRATEYAVRERSADTLKLEVAVPVGSSITCDGKVVDYTFDEAIIEERSGGCRSAITIESGKSLCSILLSGTYDQVNKANHYIHSRIGKIDALLKTTKSADDSSKMANVLRDGPVVTPIEKPFNTLSHKQFAIRRREGGYVTAEVAVIAEMAITNGNGFTDVESVKYPSHVDYIMTRTGIETKLQSGIRGYDAQIGRELCSVLFTGTPEQIMKAIGILTSLARKLLKYQLKDIQSGHADMATSDDATQQSDRLRKLLRDGQAVSRADLPFDTLHCGKYVVRHRGDGDVTVEVALPPEMIDGQSYTAANGQIFTSAIKYMGVLSGARVEAQTDVGRHSPPYPSPMRSVLVSGTIPQVDLALDFSVSHIGLLMRNYGRNGAQKRPFQSKLDGTQQTPFQPKRNSNQLAPQRPDIDQRGPSQRKFTFNESSIDDPLRSIPIQSSAELPFEKLAAWQDVIRYRSDAGVMLELAVPGYAISKMKLQSTRSESQQLLSTSGVRMEIRDAVGAGAISSVNALRSVLLSGSFEGVRRARDMFKREEKSSSVARWLDNAEVVSQSQVPSEWIDTWDFAVRQRQNGTALMEFCLPASVWDELSRQDYGTRLLQGSLGVSLLIGASTMAQGKESRAEQRVSLLLSGPTSDLRKVRDALLGHKTCQQPAQTAASARASSARDSDTPSIRLVFRITNELSQLLKRVDLDSIHRETGAYVSSPTSNGRAIGRTLRITGPIASVQNAKDLIQSRLDRAAQMISSTSVKLNDLTEDIDGSRSSPFRPVANSTYEAKDLVEKFNTEEVVGITEPERVIDEASMDTAVESHNGDSPADSSPFRNFLESKKDYDSFFLIVSVPDQNAARHIMGTNGRMLRALLHPSKGAIHVYERAPNPHDRTPDPKVYFHIRANTVFLVQKTKARMREILKKRIKGDPAGRQVRDFKQGTLRHDPDPKIATSTTHPHFMLCVVPSNGPGPGTLLGNSGITIRGLRRHHEAEIVVLNHVGEDRLGFYVRTKTSDDLQTIRLAMQSLLETAGDNDTQEIELEVLEQGTGEPKIVDIAQLLSKEFAEDSTTVRERAGAKELADSVKTTLRQFTHPVVVLTSRMPATGGDDLSTFRGVTVSSFNAVTIQPKPIVSFNLKVPSRTWDAIEASSRVCVHILAASPQGAAIAHAFTQPYEHAHEPFELLQAADAYISTTGRNMGPPKILQRGAVIARLMVKVNLERSVKLGDHVVVVGEVYGFDEGEGVLGFDAGALAYGMQGYREVGEAVQAMKLKGENEEMVNGLPREEASEETTEYPQEIATIDTNPDEEITAEGAQGAAEAQAQEPMVERTEDPKNEEVTPVESAAEATVSGDNPVEENGHEVALQSADTPAEMDSATILSSSEPVHGEGNSSMLNLQDIAGEQEEKVAHGSQKPRRDDTEDLFERFSDVNREDDLGSGVSDAAVTANTSSISEQARTSKPAEKPSVTWIAAERPPLDNASSDATALSQSCAPLEPASAREPIGNLSQTETATDPSFTAVTPAQAPSLPEKASAREPSKAQSKTDAEPNPSLTKPSDSKRKSRNAQEEDDDIESIFEAIPPENGQQQQRQTLSSRPFSDPSSHYARSKATRSNPHPWGLKPADRSYSTFPAFLSRQHPVTTKT